MLVVGLVVWAVQGNSGGTTNGVIMGGRGVTSRSGDGDTYFVVGLAAKEN